ncbi:MAG: MFS transporter [bacterium]
MPKQKRPSLFFIYLTIFMNIVGFGMIFPLLPTYAKHFQASDLLIGFLAASFALAQLLFSPIWGRLSDRFGRKPIIAMSLLGNTFSFLLFGFAPSLVWIFVARFLQGLFSAAALPVAHAYVADITKDEERVKTMGRLGASLGLGFIFGPAIGGTLASVYFPLPFFIASFVAMLNFVSVLLFLPESLSLKSEKLVLKEGLLNIPRILKGLRGNLAPFFVLAFIWAFGLSNNQVAVPLFSMEKLGLSVGTIGILFALMGLTGALTQGLFLTKFTSFFGERRSIIIGLAIMALALIIMPFSFAVPVLSIIMMAVAFGSSISRPTVNALLSRETKEGYGTTMGIVTSFESFGRILGPILGGMLLGILGPHFPFLFSGSIILTTLTFVVFKTKFLTTQSPPV